MTGLQNASKISQLKVYIMWKSLNGNFACLTYTVFKPVHTQLYFISLCICRLPNRLKNTISAPSMVYTFYLQFYTYPITYTIFIPLLIISKGQQMIKDLSCGSQNIPV